MKEQKESQRGENDSSPSSQLVQQLYISSNHDKEDFHFVRVFTYFVVHINTIISKHILLVFHYFFV